MTVTRCGIPDSLSDDRMNPVWAAARRRLDMDPAPLGHIQPELNPHSRLTLKGLLRRKPSKRIDLVSLEKALTDRKIGSDLQEALTLLGFPPSTQALTKRADKTRSAEVRHAVATQSSAWPEPWAPRWAETVKGSGLLAGLDRQTTIQMTSFVRLLLDHLNDNPGTVFSRTELAARLYGSSHALDPDKKLTGLVAHALRLRTGQDDLNKRELFEHAGIDFCLVSAPALTWTIPAIGNSPLAKQIRAANQGNVPVHINLYTLRQYQVCVPRGTGILVVENPRLVEAAAQQAIAASVVSSDGMPSTTVTTLLSQLTESDAQVWFHTDFDQGGFTIGRFLYRKGYRPWMMTHSDYVRAVREAEREGLRLPEDDSEGMRGDTPWDPGLRLVYEKTRLKVHEELITDRVLSRFAAPRSPSRPNTPRSSRLGPNPQNRQS